MSSGHTSLISSWEESTILAARSAKVFLCVKLRSPLLKNSSLVASVKWSNTWDRELVVDLGILVRVVRL